MYFVAESSIRFLFAHQNLLDIEKQHLIIEKTAALKKYIQTTEAFWDSLITNHVLSSFEVELFQVSHYTFQEKVCSSDADYKS